MVQERPVQVEMDMAIEAPMASQSAPGVSVSKGSHSFQKNLQCLTIFPIPTSQPKSPLHHLEFVKTSSKLYCGRPLILGKTSKLMA